MNCHDHFAPKQTFKKKKKKKTEAAINAEYFPNILRIRNKTKHQGTNSANNCILSLV